MNWQSYEEGKRAGGNDTAINILKVLLGLWLNPLATTLPCAIAFATLHVLALADAKGNNSTKYFFFAM